ncbi:MAG: GYDIA family GHMP kinase [Flavicella sp.]
MKRFYSNGKLLITGEYAVLDGALALALPTKFGQSLEVSTLDVPSIIWESFSVEKNLWFQAEIEIDELHRHSDDKRITTLKKILREAMQMNPQFLSDGKGAFVQTFLTFPNNWGLGTSSTLINNIAQWAEVDAFELLHNSFGGSGYDIACAQNNSPIHYQLDGVRPNVTTVSFSPDFKEQLFFVYLNQKQDSKEGIQLYRGVETDKNDFCGAITELTKKLSETKSLGEFQDLLKTHETTVGSLLNITPLQESVFHDFNGALKSLGAWGGDFILVAGDKNTPKYFEERGFDTVLSYSDMILEV